MILLGRDKLSMFLIRHSEARASLHRWVTVVEVCEWHSHAELKRVFPSADYVGGGRYVFNLRGNRYRIVVAALFIEGKLWIRFIGTHGEYDRIESRTI